MMTLPFRCVFSFCDSVVRVVTFVLYVLVSLEIVRLKNRRPFTGDANDVPSEKLSENIQPGLR
jgi:putative membrane protein